MQNTQRRTDHRLSAERRLRKGAPGGLRDFVIAELGPGHWLPWGRLTQAIRTRRPTAPEALGSDVWTYYAKNPVEGAYFARAMSTLTTPISAEVAAAYDFSRFRRLVDVGGSEGVLLAAILRAHPEATGVLFDLPEVIAAGREAVAARELGGRLEAVGGDLFTEVPAGADAYLLKSVLHDWNDAEGARILRAIHRAAPPAAKLIVIEMIQPELATQSPVHLLDLNMLVRFGGRERTENQFRALLSATGFRIERVVPTRGLASVMECVRVPVPEASA